MSDEKRSHGLRPQKKKTVSWFQLTREEALACENTIPDYEIFDLVTGVMKEEYRRTLSPSPPPGTTVYEVGTGKPYEYIPGMKQIKLTPGSMAMHKVRMEAEAAGLLRITQPPEDSILPEYVEGSSRRDRATEKVLRWKTSSPEPATTPLTQARDTPRATSPHSDDLFVFDTCKCVVLVTSDDLYVNIMKPNLAENTDDREEEEEANRLQAASPTLRYLLCGYRNYVVNDITHDEHRLRAYSCRSVHSSEYTTYKTISCTTGVKLQQQQPTTYLGCRPVESLFGMVERCESPDYRWMSNVNEYLNVFSALADFSYTRMKPPLISNAMIVDKIWTYSPLRQIYIPYYRLLVGDGYTDLIVNEIRELHNQGIRMKHIRFLSSPKTLFYTNCHTLFRRGSGYEMKKCQFEVGRVDTGVYETATAPQRIKKRRVEVAEVEESPRRSDEASCSGSNEQPAAEKEEDDRRCPAKNPTLVIFKHSLSENAPDTLFCNILVEMHLGDEIRY